VISIRASPVVDDLSVDERQGVFESAFQEPFDNAPVDVSRSC
jgi:hypothetical protein